MILVTGATGFIGNHVARALLERGEMVRTIVRPTSDRRTLDGLDIEVAEGDLQDPASLAKALRGCRRVYHVAADYRLWSRRPRELYASNVDGTRNLFAAARDAGVDRVVYTSTVGTVGFPADGSPATEASPVSPARMSGHYKRSKFLAEQVALEFAAGGLPVVIVNPTAPVGEGDFKPTPTGRIISDFLNGKMPAYVDTGLNLVDVHDVANGHLLAADRGRVGERYFLGAENVSLRRMLQLLARIAGKTAPAVRLPYPVALVAGWASTAWADVTGSEPRVPLEGVRMARKRMFVDCSKARSELQFKPRPVEAALERAVDWFQQSE